MADQTQIIGDIKPAPHTHKIRRIVTGHDENNTAIFLEDQICPNRFATGGCETFVINELWKMDQTPAGDKLGDDNVAPYEDPATSFTLNPPHCGNVFRIIEHIFFYSYFILFDFSISFVSFKNCFFQNVRLDIK